MADNSRKPPETWLQALIQAFGNESATPPVNPDTTGIADADFRELVDKKAIPAEEQRPLDVYELIRRQLAGKK